MWRLCENTARVQEKQATLDPLRFAAIKLTNACRHAKIIISSWHEEAEEGISRDEILVVAFCFSGSNFSEVASGIRHMRFFWLMIFPMPRARVESNAGEKVRASGLWSSIPSYRD
jgi:hypothetical protein